MEVTQVPESPASTIQPKRHLIYRERCWMDSASALAVCGVQRNPGIALSRWVSAPNDCDKRFAGRIDTFHVVSINLKSTRLTFFHEGKMIHDGFLAAGAVHIGRPGTRTEVIPREPCEMLRVHVAQQLLDTCYRNAFGVAPANSIEPAEPRWMLDQTIERLGTTLLKAESIEGALAEIYAESLAVAIVCRVVARVYERCRLPAEEARRGGLPVWRINRAIRYIDENLEGVVNLQNLAASVGLSRMYFAQQFRVAVGMRPHEFVRRRRIERAQWLMRTTDANTLEIAIRTGFRSQAHFTAVFKLVVGVTPARWRAHFLEEGQ